MNKRLHAVVRGRVQGVGYRNYVEMMAASLGLSGWVRNLYSGEVELTAEGDEALLQGFCETLKQGPAMARVSAVSEEWSPATGEYSGFQIRSTFIGD